jgi:hypothetical protein
VQIEFRRHDRSESQAWIHRHDGVVVWLPAFSRKYRVPHDLAHLVTERELGMARGVFGSIASGGMFGNMRVVGGRPRHDARAVSTRVLRANTLEIRNAEVLSGILHRAVEHRLVVPWATARAGWGSVNEEPFPWTRADITRATDTLRELGEAWAALGADDPLELTWPRRLVLPPPR